MSGINKISILSRIVLCLAAVLLATNIFLPIWKIELYAPQYPEGLVLKIFANALAGDVEIINGLNHYIGMKTLHTEDFVEFSILRYIIGFFVACFLVVAIIGKKKPVYILFTAFLLFAILAMVDFYRWNYNYGHDLDPHAAIKVPGMAYQPPLIGYKQLLNFGAYSIPDTGGILFITSGILILFVVLFEAKVFERIFRHRKKSVNVVALMTGILFMSACGVEGPAPVKINVDTCAYCKMTVTDPQFAAQLTTTKGRNYFFDDIKCMIDFTESNIGLAYDQFYVSDYCQPSRFIDVDDAHMLHSDSLRSPMGGNVAAFASLDSIQFYQSKFGGEEFSWSR